jgi:hypothetical protein
MRSVTIGFVGAPLASAERDYPRRFYCEMNRGEPRPLMRFVAKGLIIRQAAGAPPVVAGLEFQDRGRSGGYFRFRHEESSGYYEKMKGRTTALINKIWAEQSLDFYQFKVSLCIPTREPGARRLDSQGNRE